MIELMLSMTILAAMLLMFVGVLDQTQKSWDYAQGQISQFREARVAFDIITKNLSQATLNAYYDQVDNDNDGIPERYDIFSELHFRCFPANELPVSGHKPGHAIFFQAPLGITGNREYANLSNLLNARAYYITFNTDRDFRPPFLTSYQTPERWRYRLMEYIPPTERNMIYVDAAEELGSDNYDPSQKKFNEWFDDGKELDAYSRPLAENVVALIISPREPVADRDDNPARAERESFMRIARNYEYNSEEPDDIRFKHQLPPLIRVTMIAIDETTAIRYEDTKSGEGSSTPYMQTYMNGLWNSADNYQSDLEDLMKQFHKDGENKTGLEVRYKIFSTTVAIVGSKWSSNPQNADPNNP